MTFRKHWGIWIFINIAIILFITLVYFTYNIILSDTVNQFNQHQYIIARNSVDKIKHHMEEITYVMEKFVLSNPLFKMNSADIITKLNEFQQLLGYYKVTSFYLIDRSGQIIVSHPVDTKIEKIDFKNHPVYIETKAKLRPTLKGIHPAYSGHRLFFINIPVFENHTFKGVLSAAVDFDVIKAMFLIDLRSLENTNYLLVDNNKHVIDSSNAEDTGKPISHLIKENLPSKELYEKILNNEEVAGVFSFLETTGDKKIHVRYITSSIPVLISDFKSSFILKTPYSEVAGLLKEKIQNILLLLIGLALCIFLGLVYMRRIEKQIIISGEKAKTLEQQLKLQKQVDERNAQLISLLDITNKISTLADPEELLDSIVEKVVRLFGACSSHIRLINEKDELIITKWYNIGRDYIEIRQTRPLRGSVSGKAILENRPIWIDDISSYEPLAEKDKLYFIEKGIKTILFLPLRTKDKIVGILTLWFTERRERSEEDISILTIFANQIAIAIENSNLFKEVHMARQEWENTFDSISDAISIHDKDFNIIKANKAFYELMKTSLEEIKNKKCYEIIHAFTRGDTTCPSDNCSYKTTMETLKPGSKEIEVYGKNMYLQISTYPMLDSDRNLVSIIHTIRDITGAKNLEKQLLQAQKMEALGTLAGGIAHDFNNILTGVLGNASFLKSFINPQDKIYKYVERIENAATRAAELTQQLLGFARGGKYQVKPINMNKIIDEIISLLQRSIDKSISIEKCLTPDLKNIEGDTNQIYQAFLNICINARDAMPGGGILSISSKNVTLGDEILSTDPETKLKDYVEISISDTGIGMDSKTLSRVFDPFFTTKNKGKGTGLGLSMAYGIVKNHGGWIDIQSSIGKGTTVKVLFPALLYQIEEEIKTDEEPIRGGNESILLVDDEDIIRELGKDILESWGYKVFLAKDGREAIDIYSKNPDEIDLIILDIIMPVMGGRETFLKLKEINSQVKVIISSGYSQTGQPQSILDEGAKAFIQKPYQSIALAKAVRSVLDQQ